MTPLFHPRWFTARSIRLQRQFKRATLGHVIPITRMIQHLTVKEAVSLTGKSESTIKRLLREITSDDGHPDRLSILPPPNEIARRRGAKEPYVWKIDRQLLLRRFPDATEATPEKGSQTSGSAAPSDQSASAIVEVLREQLQSKDHQLRTLETQLDRKDQQIENLSERMRESNILMNELQKRLAIAPPVSAASPVMDATSIDDATPTAASTTKKRPRTSSSATVTKRPQSIWTRPLSEVFRRSRKR